MNHVLTGNLRFEANESRGYNVHVTLTNANTGVTHTNTVVTQCALHHFQYTTSQQAAASYFPQAANATPITQPAAPPAPPTP